MGLDQWAFATSNELARGAFSLPTDYDPWKADSLLMQWRKHPDLHGWMRALYQQKAGKQLYTTEEGGKLNTYMDEEFNASQAIELTAEDLDNLEKAVQADGLPETTGFFFGESWPEDKAKDLEFIASARAAIVNGLRVYYTSWW
jgi:hypothetical protein